MKSCYVSDSSAGGNGGGIFNSGTLVLNGCRVANNKTFGKGGGIYNRGRASVGSTTGNLSQVSGNRAGQAGGGIYNDVGGELGVVGLTRVLSNVATDLGGGVYNRGTATVDGSNFGYNEAGFSGGGFYNDGTATLTDSALIHNAAGDGDGGGLRNAGTATLTNCTVSTNRAYRGGGGGLANGTYSTASLNNCTVTDNDASNGPGGLLNQSGGTVALNNTIVANSSAGGDVANSGTLTGGHNLIEDGSGGPGLTATLTGNPLLAPLANNGGPTQTMALRPGSPAIDAGSNALIPAGVTADQRGLPRRHNDLVDIGAFEDQTAPLTVSTSTTTTSSAASSTYGGSVTFTATVTGSSTPDGGVTFVIDGTRVAGVPGGAIGGITTWTYTAQSLPAGSHTVEAFFDGSVGFRDSSGTLSGGHLVNKANATVVVTPYTLTYDGSAHTAIVTSITGVNGETGTSVGSVTLSGPQTNAGTYSDAWSFTDGANYNDIAATAIANTINKAPSTVTVTVNGGPFTYSGLPQTPATVLVTGAGGLSLTPMATYAGNVNAGTATASYTYAGDANHTGGSDSKTFTIAKADAAVVVTPYAVTYDGSPHAATYTITGMNGEAGAAVGTVALSGPQTNAGTYGDAWSFSGGANYNDIAATAITNVITKAASTVAVTINGGPFTYTGAAQTPATVSVTGAGLSLTPAADYANNVNAGTATASYSFAGDANHEAASGSTTFTIDKVNATVVVTPYTVTYNGAAHAATVSTITGVSGETGAVVGSVTLSTAHTDAGTYTDSWSFTGVGNYNDIAATPITNTIDKAALTITADDDTKVYGTVKTFGGTAFTQTGLIDGDTITGVTQTSPGAAAEAAVGTYPIIPGAATGTGLANYDITYANGLLTVRPLVVVPGAQTAYEDVDKAIGGISLNGSASATLTVTLGVGHGTLTLGATTGLTVAGNGTGSVSLSGSIANLNVALASLVYRGSLNYSGADVLNLTAGDGNVSASGSVAITVVSSAQQATALSAQVKALKTAGVLTTKQANVLLAALSLQGNSGDVGKVGSFLNEVAGYLRSGVLTQAQADALSTPGNILLLSVAQR